MNELKGYLTKRLSHAKKRLQKTKEIHGENPSGNYTYYGGQTLGYWQGKVSAYELALDVIDEVEEHRRDRSE